MGPAAPGLGLHANGLDASGGRVAGAHRTLQHGHLQCGHWHAGVVISEGRLKVVVVVLQAGTRMRACLSPAARTGQPLRRRLRAGHRLTTGHRVRGITKPLLSCRSDLSWYRWCQGMSTIRWPVTLLTTRSMPRRTSPSSPCVATACWLPRLATVFSAEADRRMT